MCWFSGWWASAYAQNASTNLCELMIAPYLQGDGQYGVRIVGTSYHRDALSTLARNSTGKSALVQCSARLVREPNNPHDRNAIAVEIEGRIVGHVARDLAASIAPQLALLAPSVYPVVDAVISNGLTLPDRHYEYSVELDLTVPIAQRSDGESPDGIMRHCDPNPPLERLPEGLWSARIWLPEPLECLDANLEVSEWTTDHWDFINFYVGNRQRIGLGFKLLSVPKAEYRSLFGEQMPDASIDRLTGRWARLRLEVGTHAR